MMRNGQLMWKQTFCLLALISSLALGSLAIAGKPTKPGDGGGSDGGGDTTPVPAGTIHFSQSTTEPWYHADMTMKADGSAKTQIGLSEQGNWLEPGYQLHGDQRWFLNMRDTGVTNEYGEMIQGLFASTVAGDLVRVPNNADLGIASIRWAKDDSFFSFVGYSYDATIDEYEEDLYVADVEWISGSPVIGEPRKVLSIGYSAPSLALGNYDWSPAGDELVYEDWPAISGKKKGQAMKKKGQAKLEEQGQAKFAASSITARWRPCASGD